MRKELFKSFDNEAIDMLDFYGGEIPTTVEACAKYFESRETPQSDKNLIYQTALQFQTHP